MSKGRRKGKITKLKSPTIVSPTKKRAQTAPLPPDVGKLELRRTVITSKEIFIPAPPESCFKILASQLEQPSQWDPLIVDVQPVSSVRGRIGVTSQVTLNLGGRKFDSLATVCRYRSYHAIGWVLNNKPKVREDWRLERKPHGTMVGVTLAYEIPGCIIGRFLYKVMRWKKVEQDLGRMLAQLKETVESTGHDQRT